jgi:DNA-binding PadR family transcriptional regulator
VNLTPTSYIVLGFVDLAGEATPYDLKGSLEASVGNFWSVPHSQVYAEARRLAEGGYLAESRERTGRRRRHYTVTDTGRRALAEWRDEPTDEAPELRDLSLLKLFFGGDPARVASSQLEVHRAQLSYYEDLLAGDTGDGERGPWLALQAGVGHEREWVRFWEELAG